MAPAAEGRPMAHYMAPRQVAQAIKDLIEASREQADREQRATEHADPS